jgi:hypothetical protein
VRIGWPSPFGDDAVEPGLQNHRGQGDRDEHGHDRLEGGIRQDEQQHGAGDPAEHRGDREAKGAGPLAFQLAPVRDRSGR